MRQFEFISKAGGAEGTYLHDTLGTEAGRRFLLYIVTKLGLFEKSGTEAEAIIRNAAVDILIDIKTQTGFALDINLVR